jgi:hypothetical protein
MKKPDPRTNNLGTGIMGTPVKRLPDGTFRSRQVADERDHLVTCPTCGEEYDARDLGLVRHHAEPGHTPLSQH